MMETNPLKVLQVKGTIANGAALKKYLKLEISTYLKGQYANFNEGLWQMCLKDVTYTTKKGSLTSTHCYEVYSNFVYGQYTQTESRKPIPLERFIIYKKDMITEFIGMKSFDTLSWFTINSPSAEFILYLQPYESPNTFPANLEMSFSFTVLFRRIE